MSSKLRNVVVIKDDALIRRISLLSRRDIDLLEEVIREYIGCADGHCSFFESAPYLAIRRSMLRRMVGTVTHENDMRAYPMQGVVLKLLHNATIAELWLRGSEARQHAGADDNTYHHLKSVLEGDGNIEGGGEPTAPRSAETAKAGRKRAMNACRDAEKMLKRVCAPGLVPCRVANDSDDSE